ncbi:CvpA family protein [Sphingorhabdus sp. 109]|jgi:membrane protein required for colicin V production|uniref:CvpA family protein n=1 Tax=Sphingorhabdus sp. 109 TaxID=2653173 RepID=UPI0012EF451A|nr:CvpA family protein [Sphingorhabdus sp. 109]VWX58526.1 Colicin V production protein [Sphingorhabdus sp. 109]
MTGLDIFVLVLMGGAAVLGFLRGFVQEALSLIVWLLVVIGVRMLHMPIYERLISPVGSESGASVLAFASIVIVIYALGRWLARSIGARSRKSVLGPIDRVLGFGFGMIKGLIGATLIYLLVILVYHTIYSADEPRPEWLEASRTYPLLHASGKAMIDFVEEQRKADDEQAVTDQ